MNNTTDLFYAGIGSRETPDFIEIIMGDIASHLSRAGWTLRSGGAEGADRAFEAGVDREAQESQKDPRKEIYLPWKGFNHSNSHLNPQEFPFTDQEVSFTARLHPAWRKCSPAARKMHTRNTRIMLGIEPLHGTNVIPVKFVICWTHNGQVKGGTGQALRLAAALDIPVFNFGLARTPAQMEILVNMIEETQKRFTQKQEQEQEPVAAHV